MPKGGNSSDFYTEFYGQGKHPFLNQSAIQSDTFLYFGQVLSWCHFSTPDPQYLIEIILVLFERKTLALVQFFNSWLLN